MLPATQDTPFPQVGSTGYVVGTAQEAKILRRNDNGTLLLALQPRPNHPRIREASANITLPLAEIEATERAAMAPPRKRRAQQGKA